MKVAVFLSPLVVGLLISTALAAPGCPSEGCKAKHSPVCGENGVTFQNLCLAECQGIRVISQGACTMAAGIKIAETARRSSAPGPVVSDAADLGALAKAAATVTRSFDKSAADRVITTADMERYANEDMVLVGVLKTIDNFDPNEDVKARPPPRNGPPRITSQQYDKATASLAAATSDGLVYKPKSIAHAVAATRTALAQLGSSASSPAFDAADGVPGLAQTAAADPTANTTAAPEPEASTSAGHPRRSLKTVFGADDRREITSYNSVPWNRNGYVRFSNSKGSSICSGSMIGPYAVLTAAHCILSSTRNGVASTWNIALDHNRNGVNSRYGVANWRRVFYFTNYWDSSNSWVSWDLAIVVVDRPVGSQAGYFGFGYNSAGYTGSLATAGYPGDKRRGSMWYINGGSQCYVRDTNGTDSSLVHTCDIMGGQSGSPMWEPRTRIVRAVVSYETPRNNGGLAINKFWYDFIVSRYTARP